jgi:hypothetical protein
VSGLLDEELQKQLLSTRAGKGGARLRYGTAHRELEEVLDMARERRAAADDHLDAAAKPRLDLVEHELVDARRVHDAEVEQAVLDEAAHGEEEARQETGARELHKRGTTVRLSGSVDDVGIHCNIVGSTLAHCVQLAITAIATTQCW